MKHEWMWWRCRGFLSAVLLAFWMAGSAVPVWARDDVRIGMQLEPPSLDPTRTASASAGEIVYANVFEGLVVVDGKGQLRPRLASAWNRSADGLSYEFVLRTGVRFHDGELFTPQTAVFSLERLLDPSSKNPQLPWFDKVRSVRVVDNRILVIDLKQPDAFLPFALALPAAVMVHPHTVNDNAVHPVGTGPFRVVGWERGRAVQLERNDRYWGKAPALQKARFVFMESTVQKENMLAEGALDGLVSLNKVSENFMARPDYRASRRKLESKMIVAINNARPPFNDLRVRRALAHAIDRDKFSKVYGQQLKPDQIGSHFSPSHPAYVDLVQRYPYDPAKARALLTQAGVAKGFAVSLVVPPTDYGRYGGLLIAEDLEAVGFRVDLVPLDWSQWMSEVFERKNYALTLILHVEPMDLNIYARDNYYFNYQNQTFKQIWKKVLNAANDAELYRYLGDAQRQVTEDAVNVFLFQRPEQNFVHRDLTGLWEQSPIPSFVLEDIRWMR